MPFRTFDAQPRTARVSTLLPALGLLLAAACHDAPTAVIEPVVPPALADSAVVVSCWASTSAVTISCGEPAATTAGGTLGALADAVPSRSVAAGGSVIVGGQGAYVLVSTRNAAYDAATGTFSADIRVRNLTAQQLGTPDGVAVTGVKLFLLGAPAVTSGTGHVQVANADGVATFTAAGQSYFDYPQILEPQDSSAARRWRFSVPASVDRFTFQLFLKAELPAEHGVLQWASARTPLATGGFAGAWAASASDVFAVGDGGAIAHFDGTRWSRMSSPVNDALKRVAGRSRTDVFAVGFGGTLHYDGIAWSRQLTSGSLQGLWVSPTTRDAFAVGRNGDARRYDGSTWTSIPTGVATNLHGVWGRSPNDVYAVGDGDAVLHWDGAAWTAGSTGTGAALRDVWGSATDLWAASADGRLLRFDGIAWSVAGSTGMAALTSVTGRSATDVYASADDGTMLHYDGVAVTTIDRPALVGLRAVAPTADDGLVAVGDQGTIARRDGTRWTVLENASYYSAIWGSSPTNVLAVNRAGLVARFDGSTWSFVRAPVVSPLLAIAGASAGEIYVGGEAGLILRYDGSTWSTIAAPTDGALPVVSLTAPTAGTLYAATAGDPNADSFDPASRIVRFASGTSVASWAGYSPRALWAANATTLFAAGDSTQVARGDGTTWSTMLPNSSFASLAGLWGSSPTDVFAAGDFTIRHWDGATWTTTSVPGTSFRGVWGTGSTDVFAVGDGGAIWHFNGDRWLRQRPGTSASLSSVWGSAPADVYAVGANGTIIHGSR